MSMTDKYVLDDDGNPRVEPDLIAWATWFENSQQLRRVALTKIGGVSISTIFLGLDHSFSGNNPPVLWETMIFGGPLDGHQRRYTSKAAALEGHLKAKVLVLGAQRDFRAAGF